MTLFERARAKSTFWRSEVDFVRAGAREDHPEAVNVDFVRLKVNFVRAHSHKVDLDREKTNTHQHHKRNGKEKQNDEQMATEGLQDAKGTVVLNKRA